MELVSNWYMREADEKKRVDRRHPAALPEVHRPRRQPRLLHDEHVGERQRDNRMMYREWFPAIMYNHHQTGPAGAVLFAPPFRDPFNYNFDPLVPLGIDTVGAAIHTRLRRRRKPGAAMRIGANYSTWFNGGIRTTSYFHNMIGILTETIGNPTPVEIPFVLDMQLPRADVPNPIAPRTWYFRAVDRVLDDQQPRDPRHRVEAERETSSSTCTRWGRTPSTRAAAITGRSIQADRGGARAIEARSRATAEPAAARAARRRSAAAAARRRDLQQRAARSEDARSARLHPAVGSARLPDRDEVRQHADQGRRLRAARDGAVHASPASSIPAGSYVVKAAQPFRPHVMDMFEPQDHPDDIPYPGGPPAALRHHRLDLGLPMGVKFDRILDGFDCPCRKLPIEEIKPAAGKITQATSSRRLSPQP